LYVGIIIDQKGRLVSTGPTLIFGSLLVGAECGVFDDIYNPIIVGLQSFTKREKNAATADSPADGRSASFQL
jgi:hypothetical protein